MVSTALPSPDADDVPHLVKDHVFQGTVFLLPGYVFDVESHDTGKGYPRAIFPDAFRAGCTKDSFLSVHDLEGRRDDELSGWAANGAGTGAGNVCQDLLPSGHEQQAETHKKVSL